MHTTPTTSSSDWVFAVNSWIAANALLIVTGTALLYLVLFYPACDGMAAAGVALLLVAMYCLMQASNRRPVEMYDGNAVTTSCGKVEVYSKGSSGTNNTIKISSLPDGKDVTIPGLIKVSQGAEIVPPNDTTKAYTLTKPGLNMQQCVYYGAKDGFTAGNFTCSATGTSCTKFKFLRKAYGGTPKWNQMPSYTSNSSTGSTAFFLPVSPQQFLGSQSVTPASDSSTKISLILVNGDRLYVFRSDAEFSVAVNANSVYLKNNNGEQSPPLGSGVTTLTGDGSGSVTISKTSSGGVKSTQPLANTFMPKINDCVAVMYYKSNIATEPGRFQIVGDSTQVMSATNMPTHTKALVLPMYGWDAKVTYKTSATSAASIAVDVKSRDLNNGKQGQRTYAGLSGGTFKYGITGITFAKATVGGGGTPSTPSTPSLPSTPSTPSPGTAIPGPAQIPAGSEWGNCIQGQQCSGADVYCRVGDTRCLTDAHCHDANILDGKDRDCTRIMKSMVKYDYDQSPASGPAPVNQVTTYPIVNGAFTVTTSNAHEAHLFLDPTSNNLPSSAVPHTVVGPNSRITTTHTYYNRTTHVRFVPLGGSTEYMYVYGVNQYLLKTNNAAKYCPELADYDIGREVNVGGVVLQCLYKNNNRNEVKMTDPSLKQTITYTDGQLEVYSGDNTRWQTMSQDDTSRIRKITLKDKSNCIYNGTKYYAYAHGVTTSLPVVMEIGPKSFGYTTSELDHVILGNRTI